MSEIVTVGDLRLTLEELPDAMPIEGWAGIRTRIDAYINSGALRLEAFTSDQPLIGRRCPHGGDPAKCTA